MLRKTAAVALLVTAASIAACGSPADPPASSANRETAPATAPPKATVARPRIVVLGDSLTAGLGLPADQAYPSLLQQRLDAKGFHYEVVNAGVSGDTSAGGLSRLDWALEGNVRVLIVALGGNDALRGLPTDGLKQNLSHIIERAQARHIAVVLAGMEAPPNFGRDLHRPIPPGVSQPCPPVSGRVRAVSARECRRTRRSESARRHSSHRAGRAHCRG